MVRAINEQMRNGEFIQIKGTKKKGNRRQKTI